MASNGNMICVECGQNVSSLFVDYSHGNIRLTQCDKCLKFADKYVEHDSVLIFIDLLLHKRQVYRHLLINRLQSNKPSFDQTILKLACILFLFDVFYKCYQANTSLYAALFSALPILVYTCIEFLQKHIFVHLVVWWLHGAQLSNSSVQRPKHVYISMALILSSFPKLLLALMIIWQYNFVEYRWLVKFLVLTSNAEALGVVLDFSFLKSLAIVSVGEFITSII